MDPCTCGTRWRAVAALVRRLATWGAACVVVCAAGRAEATSAIERAERLVQEFELGHVASDRDVERLPEECRRTTLELEQHPDDARALVAQAQVLWLAEVLEPAPDTAAGELPPRVARALAALERAASIAPGASVDYWKARLYGMQHPQVAADGLERRTLDLPAALRHARRAALAQPRNLRYLETLALFLAEAHREAEAIDALQRAGESDHPIALLLQDLAEVPLPRQALILDADTRRFAEGQWARGRFANYPDLRARVYWLPGSAADYERLCRDKWPQFRLLEPASTGADTVAHRKHLLQVLLLGGAPPRPVTRLEQLQVRAMDTITLSLVENHAPPEPRQRQSPAGEALPQFGDVFTYLYVINDRTLP